MLEQVIVTKIFEEKMKIESLGKKPRVILVSSEVLALLEKNWLETYKELPWGDTLHYEMEQRLKRKQDMFLGDGTLFGLWVVRVDTVESFEIK